MIKPSTDISPLLPRHQISYKCHVKQKKHHRYKANIAFLILNYVGKLDSQCNHLYTVCFIPCCHGDTNAPVSWLVSVGGRMSLICITSSTSSSAGSSIGTMPYRYKTICSTFVPFKQRPREKFYVLTRYVVSGGVYFLFRWSVHRDHALDTKGKSWVGIFAVVNVLPYVSGIENED